MTLTWTTSRGKSRREREDEEGEMAAAYALLLGVSASIEDDFVAIFAVPHHWTDSCHSIPHALSVYIRISSLSDLFLSAVSTGVSSRGRQSS